MNSRAAAATIVADVMNGDSLSEALPRVLKQLANKREQAFVQAVSYGVCRHFFRLDAVLYRLMENPLQEKDDDVHALLMVGLYQLMEMRVPAFAAVGETVEGVETLKKTWAKGLVNAVLRNYQRNAEAIAKDMKNDREAVSMHPEWMIDYITRDWPNDAAAIFAANNERPPFSLRVNQRRLSREDYLEKHQEQGVAIPETTAGIVWNEAVDVQELPGFAEGDVSVQDGAAQLAAELLQLAPNLRVLDACAAPGGKTAHILELEPALECVIAVDNDKRRLDRVHENLERLQLTATCITADVGDPASWWDGQLFDRILLDAPCSASGVIRRHPDIKLLRRSSDIAPLAEEQLRLLAALWPLLKPGGLLVYATCSLFAEENTETVQAFLAEHPDAKEEKIQASWGKDCVVGRQILPGMHNMDGFYFACLRK